MSTRTRDDELTAVLTGFLERAIMMYTTNKMQYGSVTPLRKRPDFPKDVVERHFKGVKFRGGNLSQSRAIV